MKDASVELCDAAIEFVDFCLKDQKWVETPEEDQPNVVRASLEDFFAIRKRLYDAVHRYRGDI